MLVRDPEKTRGGVSAKGGGGSAKKYPKIGVSLDVYVSLVFADFSKACWRYNINVSCYGNSYAITADWCDSSRLPAIVTDWSWTAGRRRMAALGGVLDIVRHHSVQKQ